MSFGNILKQLREDKDLKQDDLAKLLNVDRSTVGKWENNSSKPNFDTLIHIANYFNVTTDYLLGKSNSKNHTVEDQENYINNLELDTAEKAIRFILEQPALMAYGGYDLKTMSEDEIINLANDLLFAMKIAVERNKKK